jgi:N-acetylglutamate synthase
MEEVTAVEAGSDMGLVRDLQERAARALPATYVEHIDGWWLRHAPGCAWWIESVLPHGAAGPRELRRRVELAERFCVDRGLTPRFQITPGVCPQELDAILEERGYRRECPSSLLTASTARVLQETPSCSLDIRLDDQPTSEWFDVWSAVHCREGDPVAERELLGRVDEPCGYASAAVGDDVVAVGRAVADSGWAGLFGMATLPRARGMGAARCVLSALAEWAAAQHAGDLYLQAERDNIPALRLYAQTGFSELREYHYRCAF